MQVHPIEVWDLLFLLGLPPQWQEQPFVRFCEAVEDPSHRFALGVLWHPEAGEDRKLFEELVREAGEYRSARAG